LDTWSRGNIEGVPSLGPLSQGPVGLYLTKGGDVPGTTATRDLPPWGGGWAGFLTAKFLPFGSDA